MTDLEYWMGVVVKNLIDALQEREKRSKGCSLCQSEYMDIEVTTHHPDDKYIFSTNPVVGLMCCPLCGRKLKGADNGM